MLIYKIVNNINGNIYIGQTQRKLEYRIGYHSCSNKFPIGRAFKKYGIESFTISVIDNADTKAELDEKEKYWIVFYNCKAPNGYNLTDGGEGREGFKLSEETKEKIRTAQKGRKGKKQSPELIQKRFLHIIGRKNTPETIAKMKEAVKHRKPISEETREKMRISAKRRSVAPELIEKLKLSRLGKRNTQEAIAKMLETKFRNKQILQMQGA